MIFFLQSRKKNDGSKFIKEALKKGSSMIITNKISKNLSLEKQIKVRNSLKFLTECALNYRNNIKTTIIGITGSCGKTTLKELLGYSMKKISKAYFFPNLTIISMEYH